MLFHDALCVCFVALSVPNLETNAKVDSKTVNPETLFADVIKNISRVNNELQSLINNYEQFKRTHDSQESFDDKKDYVSDAEGGRINRNSKNHKRNPSDKATTNSYHTDVIYEEELADKNSGATQGSEEEKSIHAQSSSEVEQSHEEKSKKPNKQDQKKQKLLTTTTETSVANEEPTFESLKDKIGHKNQEFVLIHHNMKSETNRLKRIQSEAYQEPNNTKYVENEKQTKYLEENPSQPSESDKSAEDERKIEKKEQVVVKKPQERALEDKQAFTSGIYLRSRLKVNTTTTKKPLNGSSESSDIDEDLSKEVFKTRVLRQAYGDACLKVVVRKCHKACKLASTYTCRGATKCNSELKSYFKERAKAECLDAFDAKSLRRITGPESAINGEMMLREGYLSVACRTPIPQRRLLKPLNPTKNHTEPINILRDRYERECSKISQNKCITACHNSVGKTCEKYECIKRMKKNFKKNCKTTCKKSYSSKSKSSDSDSDGDSDDDSDDDSDGDSDDSDEDSDDDSGDDSDDWTKKDDKNNGTKTDES